MEKQILTYLKCLVCGGENLEMDNDKIIWCLPGLAGDLIGIYKK